MRVVAFVLMLLATQAYSFDQVPHTLVKELSAPALSFDGCALSLSESERRLNADGRLVECGRQLKGKRDGYWVYESNSGYFMHGWYHEGSLVGTWLRLKSTGRLAAVWRFDRDGDKNGVSYGLEDDGRIAWKEVHVHGRKVFACEGWEWPC